MAEAERTAPLSGQTRPVLSFNDGLDQRLPRTLELLDAFVMHWFADRQPLAGVTVLHIQHQLAQQVPQARALLRLGVAPEDFYWVDVPYSANEQVVEALQAEGVPKENFDRYGASVLEPYALRQLERIQTWVRHFLEKSPKQLLVLDDGAYLLEALSCFNPETLKQKLPTLCVVEQTSRGIIKMEHNAAMWRLGQQLSIVDVARSDTKNTLESPYIGLCVCAALSRKLGARLTQMSKTGNSLVLGYGDIGRAVARYLVDRKATFLNAGFPVNFDGRLRIIPDRYMQATQALMIAGAVQAVEAAREGMRGILDIDPDQSAWIRNEFLENLRKQGDPFPGTLPH